MTKRHTLAVLGLVILPLASRGQLLTINYSGGVFFGSLPVVDSSLNPLPDGNTVQIGYFPPSFDIAANATNLTALSQNWRLLGPLTFLKPFSLLAMLPAPLLPPRRR